MVTQDAHLDADNFLSSEEFSKQQPAAFIKYWINPDREGPEPYVLPSCIIYRTVGPKLAVGWSQGKPRSLPEPSMTGKVANRGVT